MSIDSLEVQDKRIQIVVEPGELKSITLNSKNLNRVTRVGLDLLEGFKKKL